MKRITLICLLLAVPVAAQNQQDTPNQADEEQSEGSRAPGSVAWGARFETVKDNVKGALEYYKKDRIIVSREGEITYTYGFFYADPEVIGEPEAAEEAQTEEQQENQDNQDNQGNQTDDETENQADQAGPYEPQYSYVVMQFPYLAMDDIRAKYVEKYGEPASELVEDNKGVIVWEFNNTMITMWIDEYERKPYCKKINYLSKSFTEKLKQYKNQVFNKKEIETLNRIEP